MSLAACWWVGSWAARAFSRGGGAISLALAIAIATPAGAHRPLAAEQPPTSPGAALRISQPQVSIAIYARLHDAREVNYYQLPEGYRQPLYVELLVPDARGQRDFRPHLVLLGPGLPPPTGRTPYWTPRGGGARPLPTFRPRPCYEPFTQSRYLVLLRDRVPLPGRGPYLLAVYGGTRGGRYVLAVGDQERFGPLDLLAFPVWWWQVRLFFHPVAAALFLVLAGFGIGTLLLALLVRWRRRRTA